MRKPVQLLPTRAAQFTGVALAVLVAVTVAVPRTPDNAGSWRHADGPPTGHTGGFDEPTCQDCHSGNELNSPGGALGVDGIPAAYEPGQQYEITVLLLSEDLGRGGFQGAFRFAEGESPGEDAGRLEPIDTRSVVKIGMPAGIEYIQHTETGSEIREESLVAWTFLWTAPDSQDPVVFHVAANAANGDNSPFGDLIYTSEMMSVGNRR